MPQRVLGRDLKSSESGCRGAVPLLSRLRRGRWRMSRPWPGQCSPPNGRRRAARAGLALELCHAPRWCAWRQGHPLVRARGDGPNADQMKLLVVMLPVTPVISRSMSSALRKPLFVSCGEMGAAAEWTARPPAVEGAPPAADAPLTECRAGSRELRRSKKFCPTPLNERSPFLSGCPPRLGVVPGASDRTRR
jgi:hypothetical protein